MTEIIFASSILIVVLVALYHVLKGNISRPQYNLPKLRVRITPSAKKAKRTVYTLVAVILVAAIAVSCTLPGAEESKGVKPEGSEETTASSSVLTSIFTTLTSEQTPVRLTLTIVTADENMVVSDHDGWGCSNDVHLSNALLTYNYEDVSPDEMPKEGPKITLLPTVEGENWSVDFYEGSNYLQLEAGGRTTCYFAAAKEPIGQLPVGTIVRMWFDEVEWRDMGGSYESQEQIVIPNNGQDYLTAAQEYCEIFKGKHLSVTSGSMFCYTYVSCHVEAAEDITMSFRERGEIGESTYAFYLTMVFVPENERAIRWSMAGNTGKYTGNDPGVPAGAYQRYRCGHITLADDGWHGNLVGTSW